MNLNQLYYFQKVAQLQHYHQAAKELNISQPSLSRSIANLEEVFLYFRKTDAISNLPNTALSFWNMSIVL